MDVVRVDPRTNPLWRELIEHHRSDVFQSPRWLRAVTETYDWDATALVLVDREGEPTAGMAYCRVVDVLGERIVSFPFSDYCDPLCNTREEWDTLVEELSTEHLPVSLRCLHATLPSTDGRFELAKRARWHSVDLRADLDTLWLRLPDAAKRAIRKAERDGVVIRTAEDESDVRAFFRMHSSVRKHKYRLLAQPYRFFENIWRRFVVDGKGILLLAMLRGEVIGGTFFLEWKNTLYYKFNASIPSYLAHRPNDAVLWEGIRYGKGKGHTGLDFGLSDWDQEGLLRFKRKFATEEAAISFLRSARARAPSPQEREMRGLLSALTELLTDDAIPDSTTDRAGELLYRFFV